MSTKQLKQYINIIVVEKIYFCNYFNLMKDNQITLKLISSESLLPALSKILIIKL